MTEPPPRFALVVVDVDPPEADEAVGLLFELGAQGVEERDETTLRRGTSGKVTLVASFADAASAAEALAGLPRAWAPREDEIVGDAWRDEWKKFFKPFRLCRSVVVRPPWETYCAAPGEHVVVLEPGRAFGTGLHETTSLVADALEAYAVVFAGQRVLDVGCGSGVLALAALALGASGAHCIDVDPEAVVVTRENAERNGVADRLCAGTSPIGDVPGRFAAVVANIEAGVLCSMAAALEARVSPGGLLVLSGILVPEAGPGQLERVRGAFKGPCAERRKGSWVALVYRAPEAEP